MHFRCTASLSRAYIQKKNHRSRCRSSSSVPLSQKAEMHKTTRRNTHYSLVGAREGGATAKNQFVPGKQKQAHTHCTLVWQKNTVVRFSPSRELCIAGELYCYRCAVQFASRNVLPPAAGYGGSFSRSSPPPSLSLSLRLLFITVFSFSLFVLLLLLCFISLACSLVRSFSFLLRCTQASASARFFFI